jgi:hypothetical protein
MNDKVKQTLNAVLERFENGDIPQAVAYAMFPFSDLPSARWSLLNRTIMMVSGTCDARGFRQWQQAKRFVKKGAKALYILIPLIRKVEEDGLETSATYGFGGQAVFRVEDTEGDPLQYQQLDIGSLPLIERAEQWGISVKAVPGDYQYAGYYAFHRKEICLATEDECVFSYEHSHAAHEKVLGSLKSGQDPLQEIVAELASQCLCRMVGKTGDKFLGTSFRYIERYATQLNMSPYKACMRVIGDTEKVLTLILGKENAVEVQSEAPLAVAA